MSLSLNNNEEILDIEDHVSIKMKEEEEEKQEQQQIIPENDAASAADAQQQQLQQLPSVVDNNNKDNIDDDKDNVASITIIPKMMTTTATATTTMDDAFTWQEYNDWITSTASAVKKKEDDDVDNIENNNNNNACTTSTTKTASCSSSVEAFMSGGGCNSTIYRARLLNGIVKRRNDYTEKQTSGTTGIVPHQEVSFEIVDTPIWHHRNNSMNIRTPGGLRQRNQNKQQQETDTADWDAAVFTNTSVDERLPPPPTPSDDDNDEKNRRRCQVQKQEQRLTSMASHMALIVIGFIMSVIGFVISYSADHLNNVKIDFALQQQQQQDDGDAGVVGFVIFLVCNIVLALVAFVPVALFNRPHAAGSGIAEAKAVLNGLLIENCTDLMTAACKGISVIFAASASLPIGLEGPLIFIGLSIGEHVSRFIPKSRFPSLHTDRARCDFAAVGCASGVSAAFFAPMGGVLFALEEGASFWSQMLLCQCFAAACVTLFVMYFWIACEIGDFGTPIDFSNIAKFSGLDKHQNVSYPFVFYLRDFFVFIVLGVIGGCAGALFNFLNKNMTLWRRAHIATCIPLKGLEVAILTSVMSILQWWLPIVYTQCGKIADLPEMDTDASFVYRQHNCNEGEYNQLSTLFLNNLSTVINILFHAPPTAFTAVSCIIAGTVYYVMLILLFGSSIGMGIFIPLIYIGGAFGRAIGLALTENWYPEGTTSSLVHTYSVVMGTAMLGGVTQVLISISVIMMQATALSYFVIPFMLATIFARVVARMFGARGIYDQILHLKGLPFLEEMPPEFIQSNSSLRARDIMSQEAEVSLYPEMKVSDLIDVLRGAGAANYEYQVVSPHDETLLGTIRKSHILHLLQHKEIFYALSDYTDDTYAANHNNSDSRRPGKALKYDVLLRDEPRLLPSLDMIERDLLNADDLNNYVDLSPYLQIAPHAVDGHCSAERAYESFRRFGLRHLLVLGLNHKAIGVIKRSDLFILEDCSIGHKDEKEDKVVASRS